MEKTNLEVRYRIFRLYGSQTSFAQRLGMDHTHISKILCNRNPLPENRVGLWCELLKCSRDFLEDLVKIDSKKPFKEEVNAS